MNDAEQAAADARKATKFAKATHPSTFKGSPRKLKGKSYGTWVEVSPGRWVYAKLQK